MAKFGRGVRGKRGGASCLCLCPGIAAGVEGTKVRTIRESNDVEGVLHQVAASHYYFLKHLTSHYPSITTSLFSLLPQHKLQQDSESKP